MRKPSINQIEQAIKGKLPYYFSRDTLKFFGQKKSSFKVWKNKSGTIYIYAPMYDNLGSFMGYTLAEFTGNDLKSVKLPKDLNKNLISEIKGYLDKKYQK